MRRGDLLIKILESLKDTAVNSGIFVIAFLKAGYGASAWKLDREFWKIKNEIANSDIEHRELLESKKRLQKYLSKLKSQGLIKESKKGNEKKLTVTKKGKQKLSKLNSLKYVNVYPKIKNKNLVIVSYDIPTHFRKERSLVIEKLRILGFEMIHQSFWSGRIKIPKELIFDLEKIEVLEFMEFLEVTKSGTLKPLSKEKDK